MIKSILPLRCFYRLLQFTLFTNVLNLQKFKNVDKRISMNRSRGGIGKLKLSILSIFSVLIPGLFPLTHRRIGIKSQQFLVKSSGSAEKGNWKICIVNRLHITSCHISNGFMILRKHWHIFLGEDREEDRMHFRILNNTSFPFSSKTVSCL